MQVIVQKITNVKKTTHVYLLTHYNWYHFLSKYHLFVWSILHDIVDVHLTCTSTGVVPNPSRATLLLICHTAHARFRNFSRITCGDFIPQGEFNIDNHNLEVFLPPMDKLVRCEEYGMATTPDYSHFLARIPDCE